MSNKVENSNAKPKVGRHRVYSNEQRRDRNRLAQAAFRHRRNNYTKTLEETVTSYEERIQTIEQISRKSEERAQLAELRCFRLETEVAHLRKLLQVALANNESHHQAQRAPVVNIPTTVSPAVKDGESIYRSPSLDFCSSSESTGSIFSYPDEIFNPQQEPCRGGNGVPDYQLFIPVQTQDPIKMPSNNVVLNAGANNTCSRQNPLITGES